MPPAFAGFTLQDRLGVDSFGESFSAAGPGGQRARVRRIDPTLAQRRGFGQTLLALGERLAVLEHPHIVSTIAVGRDSEGVLTVVMEHIERPATLQSCLQDARSGARPSIGVAIHIARAVAHALALAHRARLVHGGVHPRSVWIEANGDVRLADFAVAHALAVAAQEEPSLLQGLLGYVAAEQALGDPVDARSDIYGCGALLHELLTGAPPPGMIEGPPSLIDAVQRMVHGDPDQRYRDGAALAAALDLVAEEMNLKAVGRRDVARFVTDSRGAASNALDAETEDLLAHLAAADPELPTRVEATPLPAPLPTHDVLTGSFPALASRSGESGLLTNVAPDPAERRIPLGPAPDGAPAPSAPHPRLETVRDRELTPTPSLEPNFAGSVDVSVDVPLNTPAPAPLPVPATSTRPIRIGAPEPAPLVRPPTPPAARSPTPAPAGAFTPAPAISPRLPTPPSADPSLKRGGLGAVWIMIAVVSLAALGYVVYTNIQKRREANADAIAQRKKEQVQLDANRPKRGDVVVESDPRDAAVWMLLGRTPLDTMSFDAAAIRELRIESDGFVPQDVVVGPSEWTGGGETMLATVTRKLAAAPSGYVPPAAPPEPAQPQVPGKKGKGVIHVESDPPGAQVWLLVGFTTPSARVVSLPTDKELEFKVTLDGYAPGRAVVRPEEWKDGAGGQRGESRAFTRLTARPPGPAKP